MLLLFGLGAFGAGRTLGLDGRLEQTEFVQNNSWLRYLMGSYHLLDYPLLNRVNSSTS